MDETIRNLLSELDSALGPLVTEGERLDLYHVGRSVLILHQGMRTGTKDVDFLQMDTAIERQAINLFGKGTANAVKFGLYLEPVPQGLPPVPNHFRQRCTQVDGPWKVIRLWRLEWHDFAATKLKRFSPSDREDLRYLCDAGLINSVELEESLRSAFLWSTDKDGDPHRERAFANFTRVREYLDGKSKNL